MTYICFRRNYVICAKSQHKKHCFDIFINIVTFYIRMWFASLSSSRHCRPSASEQHAHDGHLWQGWRCPDMLGLRSFAQIPGHPWLLAQQEHSQPGDRYKSYADTDTRDDWSRSVDVGWANQVRLSQATRAAAKTCHWQMMTYEVSVVPGVLLLDWSLADQASQLHITMTS